MYLAVRSSPTINTAGKQPFSTLLSNAVHHNGKTINLCLLSCRRAINIFLRGLLNDEGINVCPGRINRLRRRNSAAGKAEDQYDAYECFHFHIFFFSLGYL